MTRERFTAMCELNRKRKELEAQNIYTGIPYCEYVRDRKTKKRRDEKRKWYR